MHHFTFTIIHTKVIRLNYINIMIFINEENHTIHHWSHPSTSILKLPNNDYFHLLTSPSHPLLEYIMPSSTPN